MKKLVGGFIGSFMIMFVIWTIVAWINYPDFIENSSHYHLNLYGMLQRFNYSDNLNINFIDTFRSLINSLKVVNTTNPIVKSIGQSFASNGFDGSVSITILSLLNAFVNPLYTIANVTLLSGYLLVLLVQFLGITTALATAIFMFVFEPLFIIV